MQALKAPNDQFISFDEDRAATVSVPVTLAFGAAVTRIIELHRQGHEFNLEASDVPFNALMEIRMQLRAYGMSYAVAEAMIEQIEEMFVHEAVDFTRKKKPTPLRVRMMVTDRAPEIEHDNKAVKMIVFDGMQKFSGAGGGMGMANTINGTTTTEFDTPDFEEIFTAGRKNVLVVYLEKDAASKLNGMDAAVLGAALVEAAGPNVSAEALEEIAQAIESGAIEPAVAELIESIAELKALQVQSEEPDAPADSAAKMEVLKAEIAETVSNIENMPPVIAGMVMDSIEAMDFQEITLGSANKPTLETIVPDNDNQIPNPEFSVQETSFNEASEVAADVAIVLSTPEKTTMLEVVEAADIPETLREKMVESIDAGEFTVDDFKVVAARIENAEANPAVAEMAQKAEATAKEFVAEIESSIPPVALPEPLANLISNTIQDLPNVLPSQKTALVQVLQEGLLAPAQASKIVDLIVPSAPNIAVAIVRHQQNQALKNQVIDFKDKLNVAQIRNPDVQNVVKILEAGVIPSRQQFEILKKSVPTELGQKISLIQVIQSKKQDPIPSQSPPVKKEIEILQKLLKSADPIVVTEFKRWVDANPNPTRQDFMDHLKEKPDGRYRQALEGAAGEIPKQLPSLIVPRHENIEGLVQNLDDIAAKFPDRKNDIEGIKRALIVEGKVEVETFNNALKDITPADVEMLNEDIKIEKQESLVAGACGSISCPKRLMTGGCADCSSALSGAATVVDYEEKKRELAVISEARALGGAFEKAGSGNGPQEQVLLSKHASSHVANNRHLDL